MKREFEHANDVRKFTKEWIELRIKEQLERSNPSMEKVEKTEEQIRKLSKDLDSYYKKYDKIIKDLKRK